METSTIILIGPQGAGKSSVSKILAQRLGMTRYCADQNRDTLYAEWGYDPKLLDVIYKRDGIWGIYKYWGPFEFRAVRKILSPPSNLTGQIIDFGAGHSIHEDPQELEEIVTLFEPFPFVFLLLPTSDIEESLIILNARKDPLELNRHFLTHESNTRLAKYTLYTATMSLEEVASQIIDICDATSVGTKAV